MPWDVINFSELTALASCERKWAYAYDLGADEEGPRTGLYLGSLCHLWHSRWLAGEGATLPTEWQEDIDPGGKPGVARTLRLTDFDSELVMRATWLAGRFVECYGAVPPSSWNVIATEEWLQKDFGDFVLVGRTDGLVEIDGVLTLIEVKSYGSKPGPLAYAQVSPQLCLYYLLTEEKYRRPDEVLYQGIYTYEWKTERPAADSFEQLLIRLTDDHLEAAKRYLWAAFDRRTHLREFEFAEAIPNVGAHCSYCNFRHQCWTDLGGDGPEPTEIAEP